MAENLLSSKQLNKHLERLQQSLPMALVNRFTEIDLLTQAASLSFYALLSLAPLLVLLLWLTASLYPAAQATLITQIEQLAGNSAATVAKTILQNATAQPTFGTLAGLWSTLLLFVGATAVFAQLQNVLNLIFHTDQRRLEDKSMAEKARVFIRCGVGTGLPADHLHGRHNRTASRVYTPAFHAADDRLPKHTAAVHASLCVFIPLFTRPNRQLAPSLHRRRNHRLLIHPGSLCHRAIHQHRSTRQRLRLNGCIGHYAGMDVLHIRRILHRRTADCRHRRTIA